jgi:hypothetical protein
MKLNDELTPGGDFSSMEKECLSILVLKGLATITCSDKYEITEFTRLLGILFAVVEVGNSSDPNLRWIDSLIDKMLSISLRCYAKDIICV